MQSMAESNSSQNRFARLAEIPAYFAAISRASLAAPGWMMSYIDLLIIAHKPF